MIFVKLLNRPQTHWHKPSSKRYKTSQYIVIDKNDKVKRNTYMSFIRTKEVGKTQESNISLTMFQSILSNSRSLDNKSIFVNPNSGMPWSVHISHRSTLSPTPPLPECLPGLLPPTPPAFELIKVALAWPPLVVPQWPDHSRKRLRVLTNQASVIAFFLLDNSSRPVREPEERA